MHEQLKRRLENRLRELEGHGRTQAQHLQQQQQQQQQNAEARAALRVRKIKEIVKKEGNFYEIVKLKPLGKSINASDEPYTHVLERQYSSLFQSASAAAAKSGLSGSGSSNERAKPLDPLIREDQHIPRRKYINIHDFDAAGAAAGFVPAVYRERGTKELRGIMLSL
ncbi:CDK-activating kinase assembly factor, putative [Eimeria maxima]|uniref:CDK-activating kinase assembly factor, putative n=1 Tax=Eimeria maxima TaxID=5804 RepID=U6M126_EIMMA|nr:CDK-activating kinase assembly factor, putative [Eimeria maxima]CDJ57937.1 CDK-activating kinase assembly factor, putative [Eimeria maxima]